MAEDSTVSSRSSDESDGDTVDSLRSELADRQEELAGIRAERVAAQRAAADKVVMEQLRRQIATVERDIAIERDQLNTQLALDPKHVGTGVAKEPEVPDVPEIVTEPAEMRTLGYGEVAQSVDPVHAENAEPQPDNDTTEGSEK